MFSLLLLLVCYIPSSARSYPNEFPSDVTGLTGGAFLVGKSGSYDVTIILPITYQFDTFTFDTSGRIYNVTNSTITGRVYLNNTVYNIRWQPFSLSQVYYPTSTYYQWTDFYVSNISDTNIEFETSAKNWRNDSLYLEKKDIVAFSLLGSILFFVFLGWFLWHRTRER
jgi:hypothetical protein